MRGVTAVLVLILAACSAADGTTTTVSPTEPSTTFPTSSSTTAAEPATSTTVEECVERDGDGVLRNPSGFVCPPYLRQGREGVTPIFEVHMPGTYETRIFSPRFRFTRTEPFTSPGEESVAVTIDYPGPPDPVIGAFGGTRAEAIASLPTLDPVDRPDDWQWVQDLHTEQIEVGGFPATMTTFTANCEDHELAVDPNACLLPVPGFDAFTQFHWERVVIIEMDTPEPMTIHTA
ncbi:MAG: hypothetical protein R3324_17180, partial [Halobacteriales archaeon]|nr:hypothetical protein [Halobacteriales archaeon]